MTTTGQLKGKAHMALQARWTKNVLPLNPLIYTIIVLYVFKSQYLMFLETPKKYFIQELPNK